MQITKVDFLSERCHNKHQSHNKRNKGFFKLMESTYTEFVWLIRVYY